MELDVELRALAERQHGVIARRQARALGASSEHLRNALAAAGVPKRPAARQPGHQPVGAGDGPPDTRARAGLYSFVRQQDVGGDDWIGRVDFLDPEKRLVVEVDSDLHHSSLVDEAADTARDAALAQAGYTVVRINEHDLWHRPDEVVRRLLAS